MANQSFDQLRIIDGVPHRPIDPRHIEVVDDAVVEILRRMTPEEKFRMIAGGWPLLRAMHAFQVRRAHPDWSEEAVQAETSQRMARGST